MPNWRFPGRLPYRWHHVRTNPSQAYWTYLAGNRAVKGPLKVTADSEEIVCMEAAPPKDTAHMEVACLFPTAGLTATLLSEREDRDLFYDTVRGVH